jgi:hypothetical protein
VREQRLHAGVCRQSHAPLILLIQLVHFRGLAPTSIIFSMPEDSQVSIAKARRSPEPTANRMGKAPAEGLAHAGLPEADRALLESPPSPCPVPLDPEALVPALRAVLAPLQAMLEREIADRRTLQRQADDLRDQLAASRLATAEATAAANIEHALRVSAEARIKDLQVTVDSLRDFLAEPPPRRSWWIALASLFRRD